MKTWPKRINAIDMGTATLAVGGANILLDHLKPQQQSGGGGGGIDTRPWKIEQAPTLTPEQQAAYSALLPGGTRPVATPPQRSAGPVTLEGPPGPAPGTYIEGSPELAAAQAAWDKANVAPSIQTPQGVAPLDRSVIGGVQPQVPSGENLSIQGLNDSLTQQAIAGNQESVNQIGRGQTLLQNIAEANVNETRDAALTAKIQDIMSQFGDQAVSGSRQMAAYGSDALKYRSKIEQGKNEAISSAVVQSQFEADKIGMEAAAGIAGIEVKQAELDQERNRINAELASGDADRMQNARIANAQLEAQQRQLDLDKISQVRAFENIAYQYTPEGGGGGSSSGGGGGGSSTTPTTSAAGSGESERSKRTNAPTRDRRAENRNNAARSRIERSGRLGGDRGDN